MSPEEIEDADDAREEGDAEIANACLADIDAHPEHLIRGEELEAQMKAWETDDLL